MYLYHKFKGPILQLKDTKSKCCIALLLGLALVLVLCLFIGSLEANSGPPKEDMWPCKCNSTSPVIVECSSIRKPEELMPPMEVLSRSKIRVDELKITNSSFLYLPDNLFKDMHIQKVSFEKTKIIHHLAEHRTAFTGLENSLYTIQAREVDFVSGWIPDQFRNLKKLKTLDFYRCRMHSAVHTLPHLPELDTITIWSSEISYIADLAFVDLPNLSNLEMRGNKIAEVKRSMFPNPAKNLTYISLGRNLLSSLPKDFFENMPNLQYVILSSNKFVTLSEESFSDLLRNGGLLDFDMRRNPLHCDCKLSWLGNIRFPTIFDAKCATPAAFSGKDIRTLDFKSLQLQICHSGLLDDWDYWMLASKRFPP